jgi:phosphate transport system substrate-binding protein
MSPRARRTALQLAPLVVVATLVGIAVKESGGNGDRKSRGRDKLSGTVAIDGTAALLGMSQGAARRFQSRHPGVWVTVGASGDASAIEGFCAGEVDIAEVARRISPSERRACKSAGTHYVPIEIAREGIALVVSDRNDFASCLTLDQVRSIWRPGSTIRSWTDIDPAFPPIELRPVGWKPDSPPYTLLAEALFGRVNVLTRNDYDVRADAADLSQAVAASANSLGYLPVAELTRANGVRALALSAGADCVAPTVATVRDGTYPVLSRPLFLDVNATSWRRPAVRRFVRDYVRAAPKISAAAGVVAMPPSQRVYEKFTRP